MFKKKDKWFSAEVAGRLYAADNRVLDAAALLVALCHERAAADAAAVVAAYAATIPTPPAPAGGPDLQACRQHLAAMQAILGAL